MRFKVLGIAAVFSSLALTQTPPPKPAPPPAPPTLTEVQRLTLQNALLRVQLAESRLQLAQTEFERARVEATSLLTSLQVPGYAFDLQTLTYTKAPAQPPKGPGGKHNDVR
jgi:hypothetical protein